jgi:hypothetical protein
VSAVGDAVYVHEDEWGMISLEPDENRFERARVVDEARRHGDAYRAADGIGWHQLNVVPPAPVSVAVRSITLAALQAALGDGWRAAGKLVTGYSSHREDIATGYAFCCNADATVYGTVEGDIVASINVTRCPPQIADALHRLGTAFRLILCDLWIDQVIDLANAAAIARYVADD